MSKNAILLIIAPARHQMTPDFFPALGKEPRSMPSHFISINQSVLDINQDGGKSILTQNDVIGCVELGLAQWFQWCLVCKHRMNGSKVINMNACPILTYWWRYSSWASDLIFAVRAYGTVLNQCAKFHHFWTRGSMGCHRLQRQNGNNNRKTYENNRCLAASLLDP